MTLKNVKKQRGSRYGGVDPRRIFGKIETYSRYLQPDFIVKGVFPVSVNPQYMPSFLEEFRSMKLEMMIRDLHKLSHDELMHIRKEIDELLNSEKE